MLDEIAPAVLLQDTGRPIGKKDGVEWPGFGNVGGGFFEGHYPGNLLVYFGDDPRGPVVCAQINKYWEDYPENMVSKLDFVGIAGVFMMHTRTVSREEIEASRKFAEEVNKKLGAEKQKKVEADALEAKRQEEAAKEMVRLAAIGKKCESNHAKDKA